MRFLHISDLHFGKSIYGVSLVENGDQKFWVDNFLELTDRLAPDAIVISGDVYDRSTPSGEAVRLLSRMLSELSEKKVPVLMVAGNHDSVERLSFAADLLAKQSVYISDPLFETKKIRCVALKDRYGDVNFWLMPYVFPALVSQVLEDNSIKDYETAVRALLADQGIDFSKRNVLIAHQNVTVLGKESLKGGSESMVGNVGQIDYTCFNGFDYVALGHIHAAYPVGRDTVRYAGSPMCYHFDETKQAKKGPLLVEVGEKDEPVKIEMFEIPPLHPMREMKGELDAIKAYETTNISKGEYLSLVLTDQPITPEITQFFDQLARERDSILMEKRTEFKQYTSYTDIDSDTLEQKTMLELFYDFYHDRTGNVLTEKEEKFVEMAIEIASRADTHNVPTDADIDEMISYLMNEVKE